MTVVYKSAAESSSNVAFLARYWSAFENQAPTGRAGYPAMSAADDDDDYDYDYDYHRFRYRRRYKGFDRRHYVLPHLLPLYD